MVRVKSSREAIAEKQGSGEPTKEDQASKKRKGQSHFFGLGLLLRIKKPNQQTDQPTTKAAVKSRGL